MNSMQSLNDKQIDKTALSDKIPTYDELVLANEELKKNILEKEKLVKTLLENEDNYREMVQHTYEPFFCFNPDETYRFVNDYFAQTLGLKATDIIGKTPHSVFPFEEAEKRLAIVRKVFKSGEMEEVEVKVVKPNGEEVYFVTIVTPVKDDKNNIRWVSCISKNMTAQKQRADNSEQKYKLSEEKWKLIIKNSNDALNLINEQGEQIFLSEATERMTGFTSNEMLGAFANKIHPDDIANVSQAFQEILQNKDEVIRVQYRHIHKTNQWVWFEAVGQNHLDNPAINAIVVNVRDISLIKQKEKELIAAKVKAEESDKLKSAFLNNLSHEVRTPLNSIIGFSELIAKTNQSSENKEKYFKIINESTKQLIKIITGVIDVSQLHTSQIAINAVNFDAVQMINEIADDFKQSAFDKGLEFTIHVRPNIQNYNIFADKSKIQKILNQIIDNAVKFTSNGSILLDFYLSDNLLECIVSDTGIGIVKDMQDEIYKPFRQMEIGMNRKYGGNGVGLAVAKGFVELLNGTIIMLSELNVGTKFHISIPIKQSSEMSTSEK